MIDVPVHASISEIPGAKIEMERMRWAPDQAAANYHFLLLLGEICGRVEQSGVNGYAERGRPEDWKKLADVDPAAIELVLSRIRRKYPEWRFDCSPAWRLLDKVDVHFQTAQERRYRGLAS